MTSVGLAWAQARAGRPARVREARTPLLIMLVAWIGRHLPTWQRARTTIMQTTAFGFLVYAAWSWHTIAGCVAVGVSLFVLEALTTPKGPRR